MGWFDFLFKSDSNSVKKIFISFAIEDRKYRDYLVRQSKFKKSPFKFIDMSVKRRWDEQIWKVNCKRRIMQCDGFIALLSNHSYKAGGMRWEIKCAKNLGVPIIGMYIRKDEADFSLPEIKRNELIIWSWKNIENFIKQL